MPEVFEVYSQIKKLLSQSSFSESPEFDARLILSPLCACEPRELPLKYHDSLSVSDAQSALATAKAYAGGEPLQYLLGKWEFMSLPFIVGKGVFIPNPDTEHLVQSAIDFAKQNPRPMRLLDLCAGSGCIGVSVAHFCENVSSTLVELHDDAFSYLTQNIALSGNDRCTPVQGDALSFSDSDGFDIILSNPPYISIDEYSQLPGNVTAQPKTALTDGGDGLHYYNVISRNALSMLKEGGMLAFEIGFKQYEPVSETMRNLGYKHVHDRRDYSGIRRVVIGFR